MITGDNTPRQHGPQSPPSPPAVTHVGAADLPRLPPRPRRRAAPQPGRGRGQEHRDPRLLPRPQCPQLLDLAGADEPREGREAAPPPPRPRPRDNLARVSAAGGRLPPPGRGEAEGRGRQQGAEAEEARQHPATFPQRLVSIKIFSAANNIFLSFLGNQVRVAGEPGGGAGRGAAGGGPGAEPRRVPRLRVRRRLRDGRVLPAPGGQHRRRGAVSDSGRDNSRSACFI